MVAFRHRAGRLNPRGFGMNTSKIDLASLPGLESAQGLFGSIKQSTTTYGDGVVDIMVYIHDVYPPANVI